MLSPGVLQWTSDSDEKTFCNKLLQCRHRFKTMHIVYVMACNDNYFSVSTLTRVSLERTRSWCTTSTSPHNPIICPHKSPLFVPNLWIGCAYVAEISLALTIYKHFKKFFKCKPLKCMNLQAQMCVMAVVTNPFCIASGQWRMLLASTVQIANTQIQLLCRGFSSRPV